MMGWRASAILRHLRKLSAEHGADDLSDGELVERYVANRDEAAFTAFVRRHGPLVWCVCLDGLKHEQDAEDAFQATFLVLARRAAAIRKQASVASWLHGVAYRVALRARVEAARRPAPECEGPTMSQMDPLAEATRREQREILHDELNRLAEKYRAPLVLCYLEGKTQDEAARQLAWSKRTFCRRLGQARGLLQMRLQRRGLAWSAVFAVGALAQPAPSAVLPVGLVLATVRAVQAFATRSAVGGASTKAAALAENVLRAAAAALLKAWAVLAVVWGGLVAGTGLLAYRAWVGGNPDAGPPGRAPAEWAALPPKPAPQRADRRDAYGDPLPEGVRARLGTSRLRPSYEIYNLAFAPDSKTLATGGYECVHIWDAATGQTVRSLPMPGGLVRPLAFAPNGQMLAAGGLGPAIRLWDVGTGAVVREIRGYGGKVVSLVFSPDGRTLVSGTTDGTVRLWDVATGEEAGRLEQPALAYDYARTLRWPFAGVPDNRIIARRDLGDPRRLWDAATGREVRGLDRLPQSLSALALARDDGVAATASTSAPTIRLWQVASGNELRQLHGHQELVCALAFSADGRLLASGDTAGVIRLWHAAAGTEAGQIQTGQPGFNGLAFSPDNRSLASCVDTTIRLWDVAGGKERHPFEGHWDAVLAVAFLPDNQRLVTAGARGSLCLWDVGTGRQLGAWGPPQVEPERAAFSPDRRLLASASNRGLIRVSDVATGRELCRWRRQQEYTLGLAFSPNGQVLASGGADKSLVLWEPLTGRAVTRFAENTAPVAAVAFSPDGRFLASGGLDGSLRLWEVATGRAVRQFPNVPRPIRSLAFSPDGKTLASTSGYPVTFQEPGEVYLWEVTTGQVRWQALPPVGGGASLAFTPDGRVLALGGLDHHIHRWDLATGQELPALTGHLGVVSDLAFSSDGTLLASGSMDATALIWRQTPWRPRTAPRKEARTSQELEALWGGLASADAAQAYRAIWSLVEAGEQTVPLLAARLRPAPGAEGQPAREKMPSDAGAAPTSPPRLRELRALEVLEQIGTPDAHRLLQTLAAKAPEPQVAAEARTALGRLDKRRDAVP
jgi:RNA polymerase sigma factor (sigma-70 family)